MPSSLFHDSEPLTAHHPSSMSAAAAAAVAAVANSHHGHHHNSNTLEDQRALQLALELSMLGLINEGEDVGGGSGSLVGGGCPTSVCYGDLEARARKSQNTTECVPVPSSEHVAEIVGRQGCKIKALRAKTNTYIKTPVRGEEPVFVVTGRKEDVNAAKREILSAAEHFSQIRAQRKSNLSGLLGGGGGLGPNANLPGQTTIQVRVPYRVVGLVVGPKGATIKRIQQQTNTYIITPSRDKEPIFEVTGLPESVEAARKEIEAHIAIRTGGIIDSTAGCGNGSSTGSDSGSRDCLADSPVLLMYDQHHAFRSSGSNNHPHHGHCGSSSATAAAFMNGAPSHGFSSLYASNSNTSNRNHQTDPFGLMFAATRDSTEQLLSSPGSRITAPTGATSSSTALNCASRLASDIYSSAFSSFGSSSSGSGYERDEGLGDSPTFESAMSVAAAVTASGLNGNSRSTWPDFGARNPRIGASSSSMASSVSSSSSSSSVNGIAQRPFPSSSTSSSGIGSQSQSP